MQLFKFMNAECQKLLGNCRFKGSWGTETSIQNRRNKRKSMLKMNGCRHFFQPPQHFTRKNQNGSSFGDRGFFKPGPKNPHLLIRGLSFSSATGMDGLSFSRPPPRHYWGVVGGCHTLSPRLDSPCVAWNPWGPGQAEAHIHEGRTPWDSASSSLCSPLTPGQTSRWRLVHHRLGAQPQGNPFTLDRSLIRAPKKNSIYNGVGPGPIL